MCEMLIIRRGAAVQKWDDDDESKEVKLGDGAVIGDPQCLFKRICWPYTVEATEYCEVQSLSVKAFVATAVLFPRDKARVEEAIGKKHRLSTHKTRVRAETINVETLPDHTNDAVARSTIFPSRRGASLPANDLPKVASARASMYQISVQTLRVTPDSRHEDRFIQSQADGRRTETEWAAIGVAQARGSNFLFPPGQTERRGPGQPVNRQRPSLQTAGTGKRPLSNNVDFQGAQAPNSNRQSALNALGQVNQTKSLQSSVSDISKGSIAHVAFDNRTSVLDHRTSMARTSTQFPQNVEIQADDTENDAYFDQPDALQVWSYAKQEDSEASRLELAGWLDKIPCFTKMDPFVFERILPIIQKKAFKRGEKLIVEGTPADYLHVIYAGHAEVRCNGKKLATVGPESVLGERTLVNLGVGENPVSSASVVVKTVVLVTICVPRETLKAMVSKDAWLYRQFDEMYTQSVSSKGTLALHEMPMFLNSSPTFLIQLEMSMLTRKVSAGEFVVREGEDMSYGLLVTRGTFRVSQMRGETSSNITVTSPGSSWFIGAANVVGLASESACTVKAMTVCRCQVLLQESLRKVLDNYPVESIAFRTLVEDWDSFKVGNERGMNDASVNSKSSRHSSPFATSDPESNVTPSDTKGCFDQEPSVSSQQPDILFSLCHRDSFHTNASFHTSASASSEEENLEGFGGDPANGDPDLHITSAAGCGAQIQYKGKGILHLDGVAPDSNSESGTDWGSGSDSSIDSYHIPNSARPSKMMLDDPTFALDMKRASLAVHRCQYYERKQRGTTSMRRSKPGAVNQKEVNDRVARSVSNGKRVTVMHDLINMPEFSKCGKELLSKLEMRMCLRLYLPEQVVLRQGDEMCNFFMLQSGSCRLDVFTTQMERICGPCVIGKLMSLQTPVAVLNVHAEVTSFVAVISKTVLGNLLDAFPDERRHLFASAHQVFSDLCDEFEEHFAKEGLAARLYTIPLLADASHGFVMRLTDLISPRLFLPGQVITINPNKPSLWVLFEGYCHVLDGDRLIGTVSRRMVFGEMSVFGITSLSKDLTSYVVVKTTEFCQVGVIPGHELLAALTVFPQERTRFEQLIHQRLESSVLQQVSNNPMFSGMPHNLFSNFCGILERNLYYKADVVVRQGDLGETMFMVNRGKAEIVYNATPVGLIWPGKTYGSPQMFHVASTYHAAVIPKTTCQFLLMRRKTFLSLAVGSVGRRWINSLRDRALATLESELRQFHRKMREHRHMARANSETLVLQPFFQAWAALSLSGGASFSRQRFSTAVHQAEVDRPSNHRHKARRVFSQIYGKYGKVCSRKVAEDGASMRFKRGLRITALENTGVGVVSSATWCAEKQFGRLDVWSSCDAPDWLSGVRKEIPEQLMMLKREARGGSLYREGFQ